MLQNHFNGIGCYPGDEIPKLFSYQSLGNSLMNIKLPSDWNINDFLGVVFCVVLHPSKYYDFGWINCQIYDEHANEICSVRGPFVDGIKSDHIIMWYSNLTMHVRDESHEFFISKF